MSDQIDTSAEAVARICQLIDHNAQWVGLQAIDRNAYAMARDIIRTLAAERDRLAAENERLRDALRKISTAAPRIDIDPLDFLREFVRPTARAALKGDSHE